jgi:hypothetical protein
VVDWDGLENRSRCKPTVGSNPTPSVAKTRFGRKYFGLVSQMIESSTSARQRAHKKPRSKKTSFGQISLFCLTLRLGA